MPEKEQVITASLNGDNRSFDPIGNAVTEESRAIVAEGLQKFQSSNFGTKVSPINATEAIFKYLDENYDSFTFNEDFSYTSMSIKDTKHFVKNLDKAYGEISNYCPDAQSLNTLNTTFAEFLSGNQLAVLPTKKMLNYYKTKNFFYYLNNFLSLSQIFLYTLIIYFI